MTEKKLEARTSRSPWREGWIGVGMGLALIGSALLTMGGTSASAPSNRQSASVSAAAPVDIAPSRLANADRDNLDLQLD